jgi:hypothetical protein
VERAGAGEPRRTDDRHEFVGDERLLQHGVLTLRGAHAERVPRLDDLDAFGLPRYEAVHDLWVGRVRRVHGVEATQCPDRRQAAEDLVAGDPPAAVDALGGGDGQQQRHLVAGLAVQRAHDLTGGGLLEHEPARLVTELEQIGGDTRPVDVHVDGERRCGRHVSESLLKHRVLVEPEAGPSELDGHCELQVAGLAQLIPVLVEETILPVVDRRSLVEPAEHLVGEQFLHRDRHRWPPRRWMCLSRTVGAECPTVTRRVEICNAASGCQD